MKPPRWVVVGIVLAGFSAPDRARAQEVTGAVARGVQYLRSAAPRQTQIGQTALATLALAKMGLDADNPTMRGLVARVRAVAAGGQYRNQKTGGFDNYEVAVVIMALIAVDPEEYYSEIQTAVTYLLSKQTERGAWDYAKGATGDTSMTQYAILALWDAASLGIEVPIDVWDRAFNWLLKTQAKSGGFTYHPKNPDGTERVAQNGVSHSMSVAGAGTMFICQRQLPATRSKNREREGRNLLIPVDDFEIVYEPIVTRERAKEGIQLAKEWLAENIAIEKNIGPHHYYLYGLERFGALADMDQIGSINWYSAGAEHLLETQAENGSWRSTYDATVDTSFALLFLGRSTAKTIQRIRITFLEQGTMVGGRGLPSGDPTAVGVMARRRRRFRAALKTPVTDLLQAIRSIDEPVEDQLDPEALAASMATVDPRELVAAMGKDFSELRKTAHDERPAVRRAALWALARSKDNRVAPVLIDALSDSDVDVYRAARDGLRFLSRRFDGVGLPERPPAQEKLDAGVEQWRRWFGALRLELEPRQEFDEAARFRSVSAQE